MGESPKNFSLTQNPPTWEPSSTLVASVVAHRSPARGWACPRLEVVVRPWGSNPGNADESHQRLSRSDLVLWTATPHVIRGTIIKLAITWRMTRAPFLGNIVELRFAHRTARTMIHSVRLRCIAPRPPVWLIDCQLLARLLLMACLLALLLLASLAGAVSTADARGCVHGRARKGKARQDQARLRQGNGRKQPSAHASKQADK